MLNVVFPYPSLGEVYVGTVHMKSNFEIRKSLHQPSSIILSSNLKDVPFKWCLKRHKDFQKSPKLDLVKRFIGEYRFWFSCIPVEQLRRKPTLGTYRWPRNHFRVTEIGFWVEFSLVLGGALYWIVVSVFRLGFMKNALYLGVHFSIQSTPQNLGKLTSEIPF